VTTFSRLALVLRLPTDTARHRDSLRAAPLKFFGANFAAKIAAQATALIFTRTTCKVVYTSERQTSSVTTLQAVDGDRAFFLTAAIYSTPIDGLNIVGDHVPTHRFHSDSIIINLDFRSEYSIY
jgi:hypothetical protein